MNVESKELVLKCELLVRVWERELVVPAFLQEEELSAVPSVTSGFPVGESCSPHTCSTHAPGAHGTAKSAWMCRYKLGACDPVQMQCCALQAPGVSCAPEAWLASSGSSKAYYSCVAVSQSRELAKGVRWGVLVW